MSFRYYVDDELAAFSLANPDKTLQQCRDAIYAIKHHRGPTTSPLAQMRYMATSRAAISLNVATRRAAAADPGLEYDAPNFRYRRVRRGVPAPAEPKGEGL